MNVSLLDKSPSIAPAPRRRTTSSAALARVFIDGEAGTTGLGIRARLVGKPEIELVSLSEKVRKDPVAKRDMLETVDIAILCLPDEAARETASVVAALGDARPRLLDASTAHRVAAGWIYGFPELAEGQDSAICAAARVANPGCYATGAIALLRPLVDAGIIARDQPLTINAVTGYTGGGKSMIADHEDGENAPAYELYGLGLEHKHLPEIEVYSRLSVRPIFVPSVGHFAQGMLISIPLFLDALPGQPRGRDIEAALSRHYAGSDRVLCFPPSENGRLDAETGPGTDELELRVFANERRRHAVLVARLDNLGKGASGAAVQNLELMLGL
jgi:N-acetyl-gamma-glutamyl-phosphate reductase